MVGLDQLRQPSRFLHKVYRTSRRDLVADSNNHIVSKSTFSIGHQEKELYLCCSWKLSILALHLKFHIL